MSNADNNKHEDRLDAWYDGSAVCVIVVGSHGDPQVLADHEVRDLIHKLEDCLAESQGHQTGAAVPNRPDEHAIGRHSGGLGQ